MSGPAEVFALSGRRCHEFKISACTEKELRIRVGSIGSRRVSLNRLIIQFLRCDLLYLLSLRIQACESVSRDSKPSVAMKGAKILWGQVLFVGHKLIPWAWPKPASLIDSQPGAPGMSIGSQNWL
jgi:hypothetical protein